MSIEALVPLGLAALIGSALGISIYLRRLIRRHERNVVDDFPDALLTVRAQFFGLQSRGMAQMRGTGSLIITRDSVHFAQWTPQRQLTIPATAIQLLETPRSFLGKTQGVQLLKINFIDEHGQADAIAWRVEDLDTVQRVIEGILPDDE